MKFCCSTSLRSNPDIFCQIVDGNTKVESLNSTRRKYYIVDNLSSTEKLAEEPTDTWNLNIQEKESWSFENKPNLWQSHVTVVKWQVSIHLESQNEVDMVYSRQIHNRNHFLDYTEWKRPISIRLKSLRECLFDTQAMQWKGRWVFFTKWLYLYR